MVAPTTTNTADVLSGAVVAQQQLNLRIWELTEKLRSATDSTESNQREIESYVARLRNTKLRAEAVNRQLSAVKNRLGRVHETLLSRTAALRKSNELLRDELVREPILTAPRKSIDEAKRDATTAEATEPEAAAGATTAEATEPEAAADTTTAEVVGVTTGDEAAGESASAKGGKRKKNRR